MGFSPGFVLAKPIKYRSKLQIKPAVEQWLFLTTNLLDLVMKMFSNQSRFEQPICMCDPQTTSIAQSSMIILGALKEVVHQIFVGLTIAVTVTRLLPNHTKSPLMNHLKEVCPLPCS